ncbi:helix-turn-helix domain-containing protein [Pseudonocardia sp. TRM90224]|uniref:helix-turn-helix domain-containing protein n=1 Tax=Pseudonocardia sp. TRM90224 TaxID=2812678 RepID=UPI001E639B26|nr:XRE family transcriptional regulator [Pseudonocardia sp. TRM90224]
MLPQESAAGGSWEPIVDAIGPKIRDGRGALGLSLQQLAARSGVSAAAIHKVERGDMVPTITTLLKLAAALGRPIGHFVDDGAATAPIASHVKAGERRPAPGDWTPAAERVTAQVLASPTERLRASGVAAVVEPGGGSGSSRSLRAGEEILMVLDGTLQVEISGERYDVAAGDVLHYPADRPHTWRNSTDTPTTAVWFTVPG